jgi:cell shape-determining protein MreC
VLSRTPGSGGVALKLNVGNQQGIAAGDIAIVDGDAIVGRIAPEVGAVSSTVLSVGNRALGRIDGYVVPADQEKSKRPQVIAVQLLPDGKGDLRGDIDLRSPARTGDIVRVKDPAWPAGAQGMRLGVVVEIKRKDAQPLRGEVIVRPAVDPNMVGELVVKLSQGTQP